MQPTPHVSSYKLLFDRPNVGRGVRPLWTRVYVLQTRGTGAGEGEQNWQVAIIELWGHVYSSTKVGRRATRPPTTTLVPSLSTINSLEPSAPIPPCTLASPCKHVVVDTKSGAHVADNGLHCSHRVDVTGRLNDANVRFRRAAFENHRMASPQTTTPLGKRLGHSRFRLVSCAASKQSFC
eukprot:scaffold319780_cov30-Tisochrysis_lutea.AAC.2